MCKKLSHTLIPFLSRARLVSKGCNRGPCKGCSLLNCVYIVALTHALFVHAIRYGYATQIHVAFCHSCQPSAPSLASDSTSPP